MRVRADEVEVGGGFVRLPIFGILLTAIVLGVVVSAIESDTAHSSVSPGISAAIYVLSAIALVVVFVVASYFAFVRKVALLDDRVAFTIGSRRIEVRWPDLLPPKSPYFLGMTLHYVPREGNPPDPGLALTREQARTVLGSPRCPKFDLDGKIWESVGLKAPHREQ